MDRFIVDFFAPELQLIIEIDGPIHDNLKAEDQARQSHLEQMGYRIIRFTNDEVFENMDKVLEEISETIKHMK